MKIAVINGSPKGKSVLMYAVGALLLSEKIISKMGNKMNEGMLMSYEQMFRKMDAENPREKVRAPEKETVTK